MRTHDPVARRFVAASALCGGWVVLAACGFHSSADSVDGFADAPAKDGAPSCSGTRLGAGDFSVCVTEPTMALMLSGPIDTDHDQHCMASASSSPAIAACIMVGTMITVNSGSPVGVTGGKALVLVSAGDIHVEAGGTLDVASRGASTTGAAGDASECTHGMLPPNTTSSGGGGGAGGSFGGAGGNGNNGSGGSGGIAGPASVAPTAPRGGCQGEDGANGSGGSGAGGHGGGAVALIAHGMIQIDGTIDASGAGGRGGDQGSPTGGGGGGGSGGMILLDAPTVVVSGAVLANGGGGGGGAGDEPGGPGGESSAPANAGRGGMSGDGGGSGGDGSAGSTRAGAPGNPGSGGGGGGGGAGVIRIVAKTVTGTASTNSVAPPPQ